MAERDWRYLSEKIIILHCTIRVSITVAERSWARVRGWSLAETAGLNSAKGMDISLLWMLSVVRWKYLWRGRSLALRNPTCVIVCDLETPRVRWPWPTLGCWTVFCYNRTHRQSSWYLRQRLGCEICRQILTGGGRTNLMAGQLVVVTY
jgi:hypothetical protein